MAPFKWFELILFYCWLDIIYCQEKLQGLCSPGYDITDFISQVNLQFCTFVEVGQGYCSMFVEFRRDPSQPVVRPYEVAEVYLGTCKCSTMREWDLCSEPLRKSRPYECDLDDFEQYRRNESARVHRRLCDPTKIYQTAQPCDCSVPFAQRTLYPVKGFLTCYRAPLPRSICTTNSVCGVYNCAAKNFYGLSMVRCDPLCLGKQPFCEELGPLSSKPPTVTSFWTEWTCPHKDDVVEVSESICIDKETNSPAFDCLGPGSYCCPKSTRDCHCEVSTSVAEMKVTRFIFNEDIDVKKRHYIIRSICKKKHSTTSKRQKTKFWKRLKKMFLKPSNLSSSHETMNTTFEGSRNNINLQFYPIMTDLSYKYPYSLDDKMLVQSVPNTKTHNNASTGAEEINLTIPKIINHPTEEIKQSEEKIVNTEIPPSYLAVNHEPTTDIAAAINNRTYIGKNQL